MICFSESIRSFGLKPYRYKQFHYTPWPVQYCALQSSKADPKDQQLNTMSQEHLGNWFPPWRASDSKTAMGPKQTEGTEEDNPKEG